MPDHEEPAAVAASATEKHPAHARFPVTPLAGVMILLFIYFGSSYIARMLMHLIPLVSGRSPEAVVAWLGSSAYAQFIYILLVETLTVGMLLAFMHMISTARQQKFTLATLGLIKPRLMDIGAALLAYPVYFIMNAAAYLTARYIVGIDTSGRQQTGFEGVTSSPELIVTFISLVILPPIVEEIVMRGFLFGSLKQGMRVVPAAIVTSVIFAIAHLQLGHGAGPLWIAAIDTFMLSLVLCYLRQRTGSLWAGIGLHMIKNLIAFTYLFIIIR